MVIEDQAAGLRRLVDRQQRDEQFSQIPLNKSRIITVASGKGGVGKSNVTVNVGLSLARMGKKVLVIDGDMGMANIDILLDLQPRYNLDDILEGKCTLEQAIMEGPEELHILPGISGSDSLLDIDSRQVDQLLSASSQIEDNYDIILIDIGAGAGRVVVNFVMAADEVLIVLTPEPTSVMDAYSLIKILSRHNLSGEIKLILNQVNSRKEARKLSERMSRVIGDYLDLECNLLDYIPYDSKIKKSVRKQQPLVKLFPESRAGQAFARIAGKLIGRDLEQQQSQGMKGFFFKVIGMFNGNN
ncbi:MAG: MinD/ParA family protein [Bacillota bacterium]